MKKLFRYIAGITASVILLTSILPSVFAQSVSFPNYWKKSGTALLPINSTYTLGSSGTRIAKVWATDIDASAVTIGGAITGDLTLGSSNVIKWSTDTGLGRNAAGNVKVTDGSSGLGGITLTTVTPTQGTITASTPFINHTATWNNAGVTFTNILSNVTSTASGAASLLIDLQVGGSSFFNVSKGGTITAVGNAVIGAAGTYNFSGRSKISSSADGIMTLSDTAGTAFTRLTLGGTTSSYPSIKRNSAALNFRLADDSADADITAGGATLTTVALPQASTGIGFNSSDVIISSPANNVARVVSTDSLASETGGFRKCDETTVGKCAFLGYDVSNDYAFLQGIQFGTATKSLVLQGNGGSVGIRANPSSLGPLTVRAATDENLIVRPHSTLSDGILIQSIVDAYNANRSMEFRASNFLFNTGSVGIGTAGNPSTKLDILGSDNATAQTITINATQANVTASDVFMDFRSTSGSEGTIAGTAVAGVLAYNTFTGSHWTEVTGNRSQLVPNTLLETIDESVESIDKGQLVKTRVACTPNSKTAIGGYGGQDKDGHDMVLSIGTGYLIVANKGKNIEQGDYLVSSDVCGQAQLQSDDLYRNSTVAKAERSIRWNPGETSRLIPVIYLGG